MKKILFFIPTLNEEKTITNLVRQIVITYPESSILILDDNSQDKTTINLFELNLSNLYIKIRENERGIGSAHLFAINYAQNFGYDFLVTMDGDGTHLVKDAAPIIRKLNSQDVDVVIGSRFNHESSFIEWPKFRILLSYLGHMATKFGLGFDFDFSSGFRGYNINSLKSLQPFKNFEANTYDFFPLSAFCMLEKGFKFGEVPLTVYGREYGRSKMNFKLMCKSIFRLILLIFRFRIRNLLKHSK